MATPTITRHTDTRLLRRTLQANGIFSGVSGFTFTIGVGPITTFLGVGSPIILLVIGLMLLLYAVLLFLTAARQPIDRQAGFLYATIDSIWVVGSIMLLLTNWVPLTAGGKWSVGLVAAVVALFAELQFYGAWKAR